MGNAVLQDAIAAHQPAGIQNLVYFLSDGEPNAGILQTVDQAQNFTALVNRQNSADIHAVGVGLPTGSAGTTAQGILNQIDDTGTTATFTGYGNLANELNLTLPANSVGDDVINGGAENDVILGDSIFSNRSDKGWADYADSHFVNPTAPTPGD